MDEDLLRRLLAEGESSHLDYKSEQYPFISASEREKSELLKDVLAMANAWRDSDAYILIGVSEVPGRIAEVVGVREHLDDAGLQQFVKAKTNRPIQFSYREFEIEGRFVGAIHVPLQRRPFFLKKDYGLLRANEVYLRRGSSTDVADADEVLAMGVSLAESQRPSIDVQFADLQERRPLGRVFESSRAGLLPMAETDLPTVRTRSSSGAYSAFATSRPNPKYWKELNECVSTTSFCEPLSFCAKNLSRTVAMDVCAKLTMRVAPSVFLLEDLPELPRRSFPSPLLHGHEMLIPNSRINPDVRFEKRAGMWHIEIDFGKIQPGDTAWTGDRLLVAALESCDLTLSGKLFGDNCDPMDIEFELRFRPNVRQMSRDDLKKAAVRDVASHAAADD